MDPAGRDHLANWNPTLRDPVLAAERQGRWRWPFAVLGTGLAITLLIVFIVGGGSIAEWRGLSFDMEPKPGQAGGFVALVVYGFALMLAVIALAPLHGRRWHCWPPTCWLSHSLMRSSASRCPGTHCRRGTGNGSR